MEARQGPQNELFYVEEREDGIFFFWNADRNPTEEEEKMLSLYMERKRVHGADADSICKILRTKTRHFPIADKQQLRLVDEDVKVYTDDKKLRATMRFILPDDGGQVLSFDGVLAKLKGRDKILFGLDEDAVRRAVEEKDYTREYPIATGVEAIPGKDGQIMYHFEIEHNFKPKELDGGKVDYRELDIFNNCEPGQLLATITQATDGVEGRSVLGKYIRAANGKRVKVKLGKGTRLSSDGLGVYATLGGRVDLLNGKVIVSEVFEVANNLDMSVGNLDFAGDIVVRGAIISGMQVKAAGNIEVHGVVEAANLEAGGNIVLHRGMQGMNKGTLTTGGSVFAKFIERANVVCRDTLTADALIHCHVSVLGNIVVAGKRGVLFGGEATSPKAIRAVTMGSVFDAKTQVTIGLSEEHRLAWEALQPQIEDMQALVEKDDKLFAQVQNDRKMPLQRRNDLMQQLAESKVTHKNELDALKAQSREFEEIQKQAERGKIHVLGKVHPGTRFTIADRSLTVQNALEYVTFKYRESEIVHGPCEYSD